MASYATPDQYAANLYGGGTATELELATASLLIDAALTGAVYRVDSAGQPSDPAVLEALRNAACAIVKASQPTAGAAVAAIPGLKAATIGGVRYELEAAVQAVDAGQAPALPFVARQLLRNAGLGRGVVHVSG